jgi:nitroreductase
MTTNTTAVGIDVAATDRLLTTTRSVRKRLDLSRPVERDVVLDCLRVATQAPSGGNSQRWRWLVIDDEDTRSRLAALYQKSHDPYMEANLAAAGDAIKGTTFERVTGSSQHLSDHLAQVPVHVIPCWLDRLPPTATNADLAGMYGSILPAVWSFMLALRSRGLGAAWTTLHLAYEREAGELLGIPDTVTQVALIPVAYYTGTDFRPADRKPVDEVTYWNAWRRRAEA